MDPDLKKDILDVRNVIEKSTSKVSLRDLEKKGFRKVKVLRAGDINQLIYKAVQTVLAKQPTAAMGEEEKQRILAEAQKEFEEQKAQLAELQKQSEKVEAEREAGEQRAQQIEQAHKNLEAKLAQVNAQLSSERQKMLEARAQLEREKQNLYEKGMDAVKGSQAQVTELQAKLLEAEGKLSNVVSTEQYEQLRNEARERVQAATAKAEELERKLRTAEHDAQLNTDTLNSRLKGAQEAQAESETRVEKMRARLNELESDVSRMRPRAERAQQIEAELERIKPDAQRAQLEAERYKAEAQKLEAEVERLRAEVERARTEVKPSSDASQEVLVLKDQLAAAQLESQQQMQTMFASLMLAMKEQQQTVVAAPAASASGPDFEKMMKGLQNTLTDQFRKMGGKNFSYEGGESSVDLGTLMARNADSAPLETNIKDVGVKQQSAAGVRDKLSKLRNLRGGGGAK